MKTTSRNYRKKTFFRTGSHDLGTNCENKLVWDTFFKCLSECFPPRMGQVPRSIAEGIPVLMVQSLIGSPQKV